EVSTTSGSGYASSVTLTQSSGNVSSTTIYVRLSSSSTGSPSGNITCVSTGATTQNIAATGSVSSNPSTSDAGIDKTIDNSQTVPMTANTPSTGTGAWTITSGPSTSTGQLSSLSSATAVFDPAGGAGTYVLRWTISNSPCTASYDEVSVIVTWVLPVVWLNFSATKQNETIILNWATASELNSKDFTIQHSINSTTWNDIGEVLAAGNSSIVRNYSFLHTTPSGGNNYYRIRQRDFDGKYSYSTIRMVKKEGNSALGIGVFPNPILNGEMQLYVLQEINALPATVNLLNAKGKIVWSRQYSFGMHKIDVSVIAKGIYLLTGNGRTIRILIE
ncbi:MAG: T9SS type A sorting domain-containing protein, partial [Chitinophagaceae bacterium]